MNVAIANVIRFNSEWNSKTDIEIMHYNIPDMHWTKCMTSMLMPNGIQWCGSSNADNICTLFITSCPYTLGISRLIRCLWKYLKLRNHYLNDEHRQKFNNQPLLYKFSLFKWYITRCTNYWKIYRLMFIKFELFSTTWITISLRTIRTHIKLMMFFSS